MHFNGQFELYTEYNTEKKEELNILVMYRRCTPFEKWFSVCVGFSKKSVTVCRDTLKDILVVCSVYMGWIDIFFELIK